MPPPADLAILLVQIQYPGQTWVESQVIKRFLQRHGPEYDEISFNLRLGAGAEVPEGTSDELARMWTLITQKRPDIVCRIAGEVDLVEAKVRVGFGAMGQLLGYRELWERERPQLRVRKLIVIGRSVVADAAEAIERYGIVIETYPQESG